MDKVNYETYDTDAVYDDMDNRSISGKVLFLSFQISHLLLLVYDNLTKYVQGPDAVPQINIENKSGKKKVNFSNIWNMIWQIKLQTPMFQLTCLLVCAIALIVLLLVVGGAVGLLLKRDFDEEAGKYTIQ